MAVSTDGWMADCWVDRSVASKASVLVDMKVGITVD